jgi:hypothetical protein
VVPRPRLFPACLFRLAFPLQTLRQLIPQRPRVRQNARLVNVERRTQVFIATVQKWCQDNRITQTELARELGVSNALITEWLHGRRFPVGEEVLHLQELMRRKS